MACPLCNLLYLVFADRLCNKRGTGGNRSPSEDIGLLAVTYSPTESPLQYHRRERALLPCSEWERVFPLCQCHQKTKLCGAV